MLTNIVLVLPVESNLQIVVLVDKVEEPLEQVIALFLRQPVDVVGEAAHGEDALPARHGICSHDRMHGAQVGAHVLGRTTWRSIQLEAEAIGDVLEVGALEGGGQALEEFLVRLRDTVVDFIARGPQGIYQKGKEEFIVLALRGKDG